MAEGATIAVTEVSVWLPAWHLAQMMGLHCRMD